MYVCLWFSLFFCSVFFVKFLVWLLPEFTCADCHFSVLFCLWFCSATGYVTTSSIFPTDFIYFNEKLFEVLLEDNVRRRWERRRRYSTISLPKQNGWRSFFLFRWAVELLHFRNPHTNTNTTQPHRSIQRNRKCEHNDCRRKIYTSTLLLNGSYKMCVMFVKLLKIGQKFIIEIYAMLHKHESQLKNIYFRTDFYPILEVVHASTRVCDWNLCKALVVVPALFAPPTPLFSSLFHSKTLYRAFIPLLCVCAEYSDCSCVCHLACNAKSYVAI